MAIAAPAPRVADSWMRKGIASHSLGKQRWQQTKSLVLDAGLAFRMARDNFKGEFTLFLGGYEKEVSRTTVYRYIEFLEAALEWAITEKPELKEDPKRAFEAAKLMVLQSPKPFIALMRQLGEMRKFGEYDSVKYASRKLLGNQQLELDFSKVSNWLDTLAQLDTAVLEVPEGKTEADALAEIETQLTTALEKVRTRRGTINV